MEKIYLNGNWNMTAISPTGEKTSYQAQVPGCALNDILKFDDVDVFWRDNAESYQKYENYDYIYEKTVTIDKVSPYMFLTAERLDTYCDVYFNGKHLGYCQNGNIEHSFSIAECAKEGKNKVEIKFYSPMKMVEGKKLYQGAFTRERFNTRRMQCTYGWDWTMRFLTVGMPRDIYISIGEKPCAIADAYIYTKIIEEEFATVCATVEFAPEYEAAVYDFIITDDRGNTVKKISRYCDMVQVRTDFCVEAPRLWYPLGYGEQPLYSFSVCRDGKEIYSTQFGIRTVSIMEIADKEGSESYKKCVELKKTPFSLIYDDNSEFSSFTLKVNGQKIMCKGANWVPCHPYAMGNTDSRITEILELAKIAGVNMIRVWGGGAFECEHFYDECSRLGIMVTQDFLMACGTYPEKEDWFIAELLKEAEYAARLIRNKACLMWWSGDNENAIMGTDTDEDYQGRDSMYKGLEPALSRLDPNRRLFASSPYGGKKYASNTAGTTHNTQYLSSFFKYIEECETDNYKDYMKLYNARFIAEEPCFGADNYDSLSRFMTDYDIFESDGMWCYHTKSNPSRKIGLFEDFTGFAQKLFGEFVNGEDRLFKFRYLQYEWMRITLERALREMWFCSGIIYWMLNDCWPAASSWSIINYYTQPKSAFYSFKRCANKTVASLDCEDGKYKLYMCNTGKEQAVKVNVYKLTDGKAQEFLQKELTVPKHSAFVVAIIEEQLGENQMYIADITDENGYTSRTFYRHGNPRISKQENVVEVIENTGDYVTVRANKYCHAVELCCDAVLEDNFFILMQGETKKIKVLSGNTEKLGITVYA